jgi:hypothetical protein
MKDIRPMLSQHLSRAVFDDCLGFRLQVVGHM